MALPPTQMTSEQEIRRAKHAEVLLRDEILLQAFLDAEETFTKAWKQADTPERREIEHAKVMALEEVQRVLRKYIANGKIALQRS